MGFSDPGLSFLSAYLKAGDKPKVPGVPSVDLNAVQRDAVQGNLDLLPQASRLASGVNQANQSELDLILEKILPGGKAAAQNFITNQLLGIADVADTQAGIRNATAAGFNLGTGGSQFSKFGVVGHLGRSVAQQRQAGVQNFANLASFTQAPRYNPASMFLSPQERLRVAENERNMRYQAAVAQAGIDAQPSKLALAGAAAADSANETLGTAAGIAASYFGGGMVGGGAPKPPPQNGGGFQANPSWYSSQGWNTPQSPPSYGGSQDSYFGTPTQQQWA